MRWLSIWIALLFAVLASAEESLHQPMSFANLDVKDGLSQNTVMSILQDSEGYIWLATENGLDRFDGYALRNYQRNAELADDFVRAVVEDPSGDLWLATNGGGVARWLRDSDRFQMYHHDPADPGSLASDRARTLLVARNRVWIGSPDAGLGILDRTSGRVVRLVSVDDGTDTKSSAGPLHASVPGASVGAQIDTSLFKAAGDGRLTARRQHVGLPDDLLRVASRGREQLLRVHAPFGLVLEADAVAVGAQTHGQIGREIGERPAQRLTRQLDLGPAVDLPPHAVGHIEDDLKTAG